MPIVRKIDGALVRLVEEMAGRDELLHAVQMRGHIPPASQQQRTRASKRKRQREEGGKKDSRCSYLPCEAMHASCIEEVALFD